MREIAGGGDAQWLEDNHEAINQFLADTAPGSADDSEMTDLDEFEE